MKMIKRKILSFSSEPDVQGDIITGAGIEVKEDVQIFLEFPTQANFITFAKAEKKKDGVYVEAPMEALRKFEGKYLAPEGQCTMQMVTKNGRQHRMVTGLTLIGCAIVASHVDPTVEPIRIVDDPKTPDRDMLKSSKPKRRKVTVKKSSRRTNRAKPNDSALQG